MADPRTNFPVLEDASTQAGLPLHKVSEGAAVSGKNALAAMSFKDPSGNFIYPITDADGKVVVTSQADNIAHLSAKGELAAGAGTFTLVTGCTITLVAESEYRNVGFIVSCFRDAHFQIVQVDDATETVLAEVLCGPGCLTVSEQLEGLNFIAGATGTQELKVMAKNMNALSSLRATLVVAEVQG